MLEFLIGGGVAVIAGLAGGGMVMVAAELDRRSDRDSRSLSGRATKSSEVKSHI